jgi:hypothetical protein
MTMPPTSGDAPHTAAEAAPWDLTTAVAVLAATATRAGPGLTGDTPASPAELLDALIVLRRVQGELAAFEPAFIAAARTAGVSWQALAPALGVSSRQAAERRYLRSTAAPTGRAGTTRDMNVQAERDRRAGERAVNRWANENTADLRRLAGQITALTDLDEAAGPAVARLHRALGAPDATALPVLLAGVRQHLHDHPELTGQVDSVSASTAQIRQNPR